MSTYRIVQTVMGCFQNQHKRKHFNNIVLMQEENIHKSTLYMYMVPCLNRGNLWLQQSVVPKIHPSHNKASQTEVDVAESTVLKVYRQLQPSTQRQIFAWINIKI